MDHWDEVRTAFQVARLGKVSGAADALGVHHATVIRHIDALEGRLGVKLFQRHARGYTATEAGKDLLRVAAATDDQFNQLAGRIKGRGSEVAGDLVVTSLETIACHVAPVLAKFQQVHPDVMVHYVTGSRLLRLEYGEAHVAIRSGTPPDQPDNVAQRLAMIELGAYASRAYVKEYGKPAGPEDFANHRFVGPIDRDSRAPFYQWLRGNVPERSVTFRCSDSRASDAAVKAGAGIGFYSRAQARAEPDLVEVLEPMAEWRGLIWLVTHVDLHRTTKVQALLKFLKEHLKESDL